MVPMTTIRGWGAFPQLVELHVGANALPTILHRHDLPDSVLRAPNNRIPLAKMVRVLAAAARMAGDEDFGLHLGRATNAADYGPWAAYAYCAPTLGQGLERVCSTLWAHEAGTRMYLAEHEHHLVWCYETGLANYENLRPFSDHLLDTVLAFLRGFLGADWTPDWVELDYESPADTERLRQLLGCDIRFSCPNFGVAVRKADLSARLIGPLPFPRPVTSRDLLAQFGAGPADPVEDMLSIIELRLMEGAVDLDGFASMMDLGPRSLQRRISMLGHT